MDDEKPIISVPDDSIPQPLPDQQRIENIYGILIRVTTAPTWIPRSFYEGFAVDTTNNRFYFYDFTNNAWQYASAGVATPVSIANGGTALTAAPYETIILTASGGWPSTTSGCVPAQEVESATNKQNLWLADFVDGSTTYMEWTLVMPYRWDGGTVAAYFYWMANSSSTNNVIWQMEGRAYVDGDILDQAWGTAITRLDSNTGTNKINISLASPAMTFAGSPGSGQMCQIRVARLGGDASDTLAATARLIAVRLVYLTNGYTD